MPLRPLSPLSAIALVLTSGSLLLAGCGGNESEGGATKLTIYTGRSEELVGPLITRFERESGVDVTVRYGESSELAAVVREEGDRSPADVVWMQDAGSLDALGEAKLLRTLPGSITSRVPAQYRSTEGQWAGTSARARVIAYDSRKLQRSAVPTSVFDLTGPQWKGKVGWAPTNASFQAFVTAMRVTEGEAKAKAWIEGMIENDAQRLESNVAIRDAIATGELQLGLINHYYVAEAKADDPSYPVDVLSPPGDIGAMVNVAGVGVVAGTDEAKAAERFASFLLTDKTQQEFVDSLKEYSVLPGFKTPTDVQPLSEIKQPKAVDLSKLADQQGTVQLLQDAGVL